MASITVNGNTIVPIGSTGEEWTVNANDQGKVRSAPDAKDSNFILVQVDRVLTIAEKGVLADHQVEIQEYVAEKTFLCRYEPDDLEALRLLPFVVTADM